MAPVEQQALDYLKNKQDRDLAALLRSQPSSANAAHVSLDKLAQACMPTSFISLLQLLLTSQQDTDLSEGSPSLALHQLVSDTTDQNSSFVYEVLTAMQSAGLSVNQANEDKDTPLHLAARAGHLQLCQQLVGHGADPLARNSKNRTPGGQAKLSSDVKAFLAEAESEAKERRQMQKNGVWDEKMKATQTQSAYGVQCL